MVVIVSQEIDCHLIGSPSVEKDIGAKHYCFDDAQLLGKLTFFSPWVGKYYSDDQNNVFGKVRILVLGESHYCKDGTDLCRKCCGAIDPLQLNREDICKYEEKIKRRKVQMGNCHGDACCNFTRKIIECIKQIPTYEKVNNNSWEKDFKRTEKYLMGIPRGNEDWSSVWDSVAFYNFVQTAYLDKGDKPYTNKYNEFSLSTMMLQDVVQILKPNIILAWGGKAWKKEAKKAFQINDFSLVEGGSLKDGDTKHHDKINRCNYWMDEIKNKQTGDNIYVLIPYHPAARVSNDTFNAFSTKCSEQIKDICSEINKFM